MDDALIRTFAKERDYSFRWRTWTEGDRAYADIEVREGATILYTARTNGRWTEQELLDGLMQWAIEEITDKPRYVISGWDHAKSGRREVI